MISISLCARFDWSHMLSPCLSWPFPAGKGRERLCVDWERNNTWSSFCTLCECDTTEYVTNIFKPPEYWQVRLESICLHTALAVLWNYSLLLWHYKSFTLLSADMIKPYHMEFRVQQVAFLLCSAMELRVQQVAFLLCSATDRSPYVLFQLG